MRKSNLILPVTTVCHIRFLPLNSEKWQEIALYKRFEALIKYFGPMGSPSMNQAVWSHSFLSLSAHRFLKGRRVQNGFSPVSFLRRCYCLLL